MTSMTNLSTTLKSLHLFEVPSPQTSIEEILKDVQTRFETEAEVSLDRRFNLEKSELIPGEEG